MSRKNVTGKASLRNRVRTVLTKSNAQAGRAGAGLEKRRLRELRALREATPSSTRVDLGRSLREVNKLIFVQDFEKAGKLLRRLSEVYPADYEVQFRRIEVAARTEELEDVCHEYTSRALHNPQVLALQLAASLAEIRFLERSHDEGDEHDALVNPSLSSRRDVTGLSLETERLQGGGISGLAGGLSRDARSLYSSLGSTSAARVSAMGGLVRIPRNPSVADDAVPEEMPPLADAFADDAARVAGESWNERQVNPAVVKANELVALHPDHFAAWYVAGCAFEYVGDLSRAVDAWTKALRLNPSSVSVLSTLSELQQIGALSQESEDFTQRFESVDKYLVHGSFETHMELHKEYLARGEYTLAIAALRTLADWIQRQRGEVPPEIEAVSLLGAMKAYRLAGNVPAAEACRREAENIVIAAKKGGESPSQMAFMGQAAEEQGLAPLARMCYFSVLTSRETSEDLAIRTAAHCVSVMPSHSLKEVLQTAYQIHGGHTELRFCALLCALNVAGVPVKRYMERRAKARTAVGAGDLGGAVALLEEGFRETDEDPEAQMLMGECLWRIGRRDESSTHFARMYWLDSLNAEFALRFVSHLVRLGEFSRAEQVALQAMDIATLGQAQLAELHWVRATSLHSFGQQEEARIQMNKALAADPWNAGYLALALRLLAPENSVSLPQPDVLVRFEDWVDSRGKTFPKDLVAPWLERARAALRAGWVEYAWTMARTLFLYCSHDEETTAFYASAGAAWNSRNATQQTLQLLSKGDVKSGLPLLATMVARIYGRSGEWALVDEWTDIAVKAGLEDRKLRSRLFEVEALALALKGVEFPRAQSLIEAAIDVYEGTGGSAAKMPPGMGVLHGYLLLAQGDIKGGLDRMRTHTKEDACILNLYFLVKGLSRAGRLADSEREHLEALLASVPVDSLEQKLIEEIHCVAGLRKSRRPVNLTC
ncbi:MAG: tetratricopeptide repeat protein [Silvanigrellales bacterium]|jgi:tetratricopeptide (TPR) repeat protein|nr:tetratricopeptide repeat protein [Silvanigrellales bacterium]